MAATAWIVWFNIISTGHLVSRIAMSAVVAFCALCWSAVIVLAVRFMVRDLNGADWVPLASRAAAAGIWFARALLLTIDFSWAGALSAAVLLVGATRMMLDPFATVAGHWRRTMPETHFGAALTISLCFQTACTALLMRHHLPAAALMDLGLAMLVTLVIASGVWSGHRAPNLPRSVVGLCLTVVLALMVSQVWGPGGFGASGSGSARAASQGSTTGAKAVPPPPPPAPESRSSHPIPGHEYEIPGSFPGVILWPELQAVPTLIEPILASHGSTTALTRKLVIPFGGEYWMFRWPFDHPPFNSFFQRGTPAWLVFSTSDGLPLQMEAHQKLEQSIDLGCCKSIDVDIVNADHAGPHISLELLLIDHQPPVSPPVSLGMARVTSVPGVDAGRTIPVAETLSFPVPPDRRSMRFDEFEVIFRRAIGLQSHSTRIALQRFVLTP